MSNSVNNAFEHLKAFGVTGGKRFKDFTDARITELHRSLESASNMDTVTRIQGALDEIRKIQKTMDEHARV